MALNYSQKQMKGGKQMPYTYNKLRGRIIEKYGSQSAFADEIGRSQVSVSRKLQCKSEFSQEDMNTWARFLDIGLSEYGVYFFT